MFRFFLLLCIASLFCSCEQIVIDDGDDVQQGALTSYRITTRAVEGTELVYPLHIYAFSSDGVLQAETEASNPESPISLSLVQGREYRLVIVSAHSEAFDCPSRPTLSSLISLKSLSASKTSTDAVGYTVTEPLVMGFATLSPSSAHSVNCNVQMQHQMSALRITLNSIPSHVDEVSVCINSPYQGVTFAGALQQGSGLSRIPLSRKASSPEEGDTWESGDVYVFPTVDPQTVFTIVCRSGDNEICSSVTYRGVLHAGTPYVLNGSFYDDSFHASANITPPEWLSPIFLNFNFGEGLNPTISVSGTGEDVPTAGEDSPVSVTRIPRAYSSWDGHMVVAVTDDEGKDVDPDMAREANLLLMSLDEWTGLTSVSNESSPTMAFEIAKGYSEAGLQGWRIPTEDEGRLLYRAYNELVVLDDGTVSAPLPLLLESMDAVMVSLTQENGDKVRYLCADASKTFSFGVNSILSAGKTVKNYHLRLVRSVKVSL